MIDKSQDREIPAVITQGDNEVRIEFDSDIPTEIIETQVVACQTHTCDCCTPEFREQVEEFKIMEIKGGVTLRIKGSISAEHVRENMFACAPKLKHQE